VYYFHLDPWAIAGAEGSTLHGSAVSFRTSGLEQLTAFQRAMRKHDWQGVRHSAVFLEGDPATKILQAAKDADLVVLGSHGRSGLASVLLGGTAYAVLKRAKKPVLVVRAPGRKFLIR
jgi:nucleotide-binding universal stress UspA family protein